MRTLSLLTLLLLTTAAKAVPTCPTTVTFNTLPTTGVNSWNATQVFSSLRHPGLSLNGFSSSQSGLNSDYGYGLKEVLERIYPTTTDFVARTSYVAILQTAEEALEIQTNGTSDDAKKEDWRRTNRNLLRLEARSFVALTTFFLDLNGQSIDALNECGVGVSLPYPATALTRLKDALLSGARWLPDLDYNDDGIKWADGLMNAARAFDLYLALENAYVEHRPSQAAAALLSSAEKAQFMFDYSKAMQLVENSRKYYPLGNRYQSEPGNWPLMVKTAVGYAALTQQADLNAPMQGLDFCQHSTSTRVQCDYVGMVHRSFYAVLAPAGVDRDANFNYQTKDGERFWAEGPYYFDIVLSKVIPFLHAARLGSLLTNTNVTGLSVPYTANPFTNPTLTDPIEWLADLATPEGATPPLDEGNRARMSNAGLLAWQGTYGATGIGQKFAWIAQQASAGLRRSNQLAELAIPRLPFTSGTLPVANVGNVTSATPTEYDEQQLVIRRPSQAGACDAITASGECHYVLLNGEAGKSDGSPGDAIGRGEGHDQPDNMQLMYYVDGASYLMDTGYDKGQPTVNGSWSNYYNHNVLMSTGGHGGLKAPYVSVDGWRKHATHTPVSKLYREQRGSIAILHGEQRLNVDSPLNVPSTYKRDVLFVEGASPYLIDLNRNRLDTPDSNGECSYLTRYHVDTQAWNAPTMFDGYTGVPSFFSANAPPAGPQPSGRGGTGSRLHAFPLGIEHRLYRNSASSRNLYIDNNDAEEFKGDETAGGYGITHLDICDDGGQDFGVATVVKVSPSVPSYTPKVTEAYPQNGTARTQQGFVWQQGPNTFDVFVARSTGSPTNSNVLLNPSTVDAAFPNISVYLPPNKDCGFVRIQTSGTYPVIDANYNVDMSSALTAVMHPPTCAVTGQAATASVTAWGGLPGYTYVFETQPASCESGGGAFAAQGSGEPAVEGGVIEPGGDGGGGVLDGLPTCGWSYAAGGSQPYGQITRSEDYDLRVTVTDRSGNSFTTSPERVMVQSSPCQGAQLADGDVQASKSASETPSLTRTEAPPAVLTLRAPAPNPAAHTTTLRVGLPASAHVDVAVYDLLGREVTHLSPGELDAGWHRVGLDVSKLAPGVYVLRLVAGTDVRTERLIVRR